MSNLSITEDEIRERCLLRLEHAVQALALPAEAQLSLFPDFVCKVEELAIDFDNWWGCVKARAGEMLNAEQAQLLGTIDMQLNEMSGQVNAALWTETALHTAAKWVEIREIAKKTLLAFGWANTVPPSYAHEYVRGS